MGERSDENIKNLLAKMIDDLKKDMIDEYSEGISLVPGGRKARPMELAL